MSEFAGTLPNGKIPLGGCGVSSAGTLTQKFTVHSRGPNYGDIPDTEPTKKKTMKNSMRMSVYTALDTSQLLKAETVALSPISTGPYMFPVDLCANYMVSNVIEWASVAAPGVTTINMYASTQEEFQAFSKELTEINLRMNGQ